MRKIVLLLIAILICGLTFGCATPTTSVPTQPPPAPPPPPKIYEKDTQGILPVSWYRDSPEARESQTLRFNAIAQNRVEGEVTIYKIPFGNSQNVMEVNDYAIIFAFVEDPYGNKILQHGTYTISKGSQQKFPWQFSFIASTTGEFGLEVNTGFWMLQGALYTARLKVTVYDE